MEGVGIEAEQAGGDGLKRAGYRITAMGVLAILLLGFQGYAAAAQSVTAVPRLDLNRYMGTWYEIARLPDKTEKKCVRNVRILYALGDKKGTFQMGTSCELKDRSPDEYDATGKSDKHGSGRLKLNHLVLFSTPYWVLATGPQYEWALVGSPKHKTLWILSRTATLDPDVLARIKGEAVAQGYDPSRLITVAQAP